MSIFNVLLIWEITLLCLYPNSILEDKIKNKINAYKDTGEYAVMDQVKFKAAIDKVVQEGREKNGIGTLGEKTVHAVVKHYFEQDVSKQEVRVEGFVADIRTEEGIIEVQTRNFNTLRKKLDIFLKLEPVTIVYPIAGTKWLRWVDEETGEITNRRKSPKTGTPYHAFYELYKIREYLLHSNLTICLLIIDMEEYRLLNGWSKDRKKGSSRYDSIPLELKEEIWIAGKNDYEKLIPALLPAKFLSYDYKKKSGLSLSQAQLALNILHHVGAVKRIGKKGNAFYYSVV